MTKIKILKKEDKIEELGNKICKLVKYYERKDGYSHVLQVATLADVLLTIREILKSYDERFKKMEEYLEYKDRNRLKYIESLKKQIESYKKIIREKKFTAGYRRSCQEAVKSLEALLK